MSVRGAPSLRECFHQSRSEALRPYRAVVAVAWFIVGLTILLGLMTVLHFPYRDGPGIGGWVSANHYPKYQEMVWFGLAVAGIPAVMLLGQLLWDILAWGLAKIGRIPSNRTLKLVAVASVCLLAPLPKLVRLQTDLWGLLLAGAGGWIAISIGLAVFGRSARGNLPAPRLRQADARPPDGELEEPRNGGRDSVEPLDHPPIGTLTPYPELREDNGEKDGQARGLSYEGARRLRRVLVYGILPLLIYLLHYQPGIDRGVDLFHEGEFLTPLNEMLHGAVPYRDIYLQHGLFHNAWFPWLGSRWFGTSLEGVRTMHRLLGPLPYVALYLLGLQVFRGRWFAALALSLVFLGSLNIPSRATLGLLSLAAIAAAVNAPGRRRAPRGAQTLSAESRGPAQRSGPTGSAPPGRDLVAAGIAAGLALWHSVEIGLYTTAAVAAFLVLVGWHRRVTRRGTSLAPLRQFAAGWLVAFGVIGWYFLWHGALDDVFRNFWIQCVYQTDTWGVPFPKFLKVFEPLRTGFGEGSWQKWLLEHHLQWYWPIATFMVGASYVAYRACGVGFWRSPSCPTLLLIILAAVAYSRTTLGRSDGAHIHYGQLFGLVLVVWLADHALEVAWDRWRAPGRRWTRLGRAIPWLTWGLAVATGFGWYVHRAYQPVDGLVAGWQRLMKSPPATAALSEPVERAGLVDITQAQADHLRAVVAALRERVGPDEPVFDFSNQAAYLFFANRRSATPYFQICYASLPSSQWEVVDALERQQVRTVIFRAGGGYDGIDGVRQADRHPIVAQYLNGKYEPEVTIDNRVVLWRRKDSAREGD